MGRNHIKYGLLAVIPCLAIAAIGCTSKEPPKQAETPAPKAKVVAATVSFVKGEVRAFTEASWKPLAIGFELEAGDSLDLAEGAQAELKGPGGLVAKLAGPERVEVGGLMSSASAAESSAAGKVVSKVRKLEGKKQTYSAQTPTAVAGIRGAKARVTVPDSTKKDSLPEK